MSDMMPFPASWEDFLQEYSFKDKEEIYTNGSDLISVFRVRQMMEHYHHDWVSVKDRLPEEDGEYMIWYKGELGICDFDAELQTFGYTYEEYDEMYSWLMRWDDCIDKYVTHWMPLPTLPESEDDANERMEKMF